MQAGTIDLLTNRAVRKHLPFGPGICRAQWTNYRWSTEYFKCTSVLQVFMFRASSRPLGMGLPRTFWVKLNHLCSCITHFYSFMHKWGLAPSPNCRCVATNQTAENCQISHPSTCPYIEHQGVAGLMVLNDNTRC